MRPFEFVSVFYSVVLGVAVAQLMTGVARLVEQRHRVRTYWVHTVWVIVLLLTDATNWWSLWDLRDARSWHVGAFLLLIALTAVIFVMTVLLFPREPDSSDAIDLRAHYYANSAVFLRATAAACALSVVCNWIFYPVDTWLDPWLSIPGAIVVLALLVALTRRPVLHAFLSLFTLVGIIAMLLLQGMRIQ